MNVGQIAKMLPPTLTTKPLNKKLGFVKFEFLFIVQNSFFKKGSR